MGHTDPVEPHHSATSGGHALWYHRARTGFHDYHWTLLGAGWALALTLGCIGFARYFLLRNEARTPLDILYLSLQLFTLESGAISKGAIPWTLEIARFLAPAIAAYTALQALTVVFSEQFQRVLNQRIRNHIVICGLGRKGYLLTKSFRNLGDRVVVIETDEEQDRIQQCKDMGAIVKIGNATSLELLKQARAHRARVVISVCGDDGINAAVAVRVRELVQDCSARLTRCIIHITDAQLCELLRKRADDGDSHDDNFVLEFFNVFEDGARVMLQKYPPFTQTHTASGSNHLLVIGLGRMGENVVLQAARDWQSKQGENRESLRMTIIDRQAQSRLDSLMVRHPGLDAVCDIITFQMDVQDAQFREAAFLYGTGARTDPGENSSVHNLPISVVYVCMDDDSLNLSSALILHHRLRTDRVPIIVRMLRETGLAQLLGNGSARSDSFENLHAFGLLDQTCTPEILLSDHGNRQTA